MYFHLIRLLFVLFKVVHKFLETKYRIIISGFCNLYQEKKKKKTFW